jgi:putative transposase
MNAQTALTSASVFSNWTSQLRLTPEAVERLRRVRCSDPARRTRGRKNVRGSYPSMKMGVTIQFESHRNELPTILEFEHDSDVLEYYDQPETIRLNYLSAAGRPGAYDHIPDFLVLTRTGVIWVECKTEDKLVGLSKESPNRFVRNRDGTWRSPPGEEYAAKFGFTYRIRSSLENSSELSRNLHYLDEYFTHRYPEPFTKVLNAVISYVASHEGVKYTEVLKAVPGLSADDLNYFISRGTVFTDLRRVVLADLESVTLYSSMRVWMLIETSAASSRPPRTEDTGIVDLQAGAKVRLGIEDLTIMDVSEDLVLAFTASGEARHIRRSNVDSLVLSGTLRGLRPADETSTERTSKLLAAGPNGQTVMLARWQAIEPFLAKRGHRRPKKPGRSIERWVQLFRAAENQHGCGILGLLPKARSGNPTPRLRAEVLALIEKFIDEQLLTPTNPSITHVYGNLVRECDRLVYDHPSFKTFQRATSSRGIYERKRKTQGSRSAYPHSKRFLFIDQLTPIHGDRPWEICHIDHTQLDLEMLSDDNQNLGRPWFTILIDAYSRRILAISVSFFPPSYEACMRILRICVKRHNRLPQTIVVDNGKEFQSNYFETLLAAYLITKKSRPPAKARFGSVCERIFGTVNTQFIHNLQGNTKIMRNVRQVTVSSNPKNLAIWTLSELTPALQTYCYDTYESQQHKTLGATPRDFYARGMIQSGLRRHVYVADDDMFFYLTLPSTKSGFATINPKNGVRIQYLDYWNDAFAEPKLANQKVPVRINSRDITIAYVFIKQKWTKCISSNSHLFTNCAMRTADLAAEELKQKKSLHDKKRQITAKQLADQMKDMAETETMLLHRKRLNESGAAHDFLMNANKTEPKSQVAEPEPPKATTSSPTVPKPAPAGSKFQGIFESIDNSVGQQEDSK